jgi:leader peptidase (prepilin peptidase)/N-methyltransferase
MQILIAIFIFIFGAVIGSFLNVVIYRYNTGKGLGGRSMCGVCGKTLEALELIPIVSFLFLRGRCRVCKTVISIQYPFVELLTGLLFVAVSAQMTNTFTLITPMILVQTTLFLLATALFVVVTVYDWKHKIIPDGIVFSLWGLGAINLVMILVSGGNSLFFWETLLAGPLLALPFWALWQFSKGRWIGLGDAKLAWAFGWLFGLELGLSGLVFGFWIGTIFTLGIMGLSKLGSSKKLWLPRGFRSLTMKSEIPLGPFLVAGMYVAFFSGIVVFNLSIFFYLLS